MEIEKQKIFNKILEDLKQFKNKNLYRCQCCDEFFEWDSACYDSEEQTYTCPECNETFDEIELQNVSIYDLVEHIYIKYLIEKGEIQNGKY
ncbi:MAG: hypothetical protein IKT27_01755 [Clostridia bacterium]|nr:hypothetical protein [Clostridia bacterium]MBR4998273.1 hypothetical protein [Clostridia bacterium]